MDNIPFTLPEDVAGFNENWLRPGGFVPVDASTTAILIAEVCHLRASIPSMVEEIERLRQTAKAYEVLQGDCAECFTENDRLRSLNAELLEVLQDFHDYGYDRRRTGAILDKIAKTES